MSGNKEQSWHNE